ncbi:MAG: hypothetical protein AAGI23_08005 [Bacteroidota bacterium]
MNTRLLSFLFFVVIAAACDDFCPPDEQVGELELTPSTLSFNPYTDDSRLVFLNANGDSLVFTAPEGVARQIDQLCVQELCTEPKIKGETTCEFFTSETERLVFFDEDQTATIDFLVYSDVVAANTRQFYQAVQVSVSQNLFSELATVVTDSINVAQLDRPNLSVLNYFEAVGTIELNGQTYEETFAFEGTLMTIYLTRELGLVGFETSETVWNKML